MAAVPMYPDGLRERVTRLAVEARKDPKARVGAIKRIAGQFDVPVEALRGWVEQVAVTGGLCLLVTVSLSGCSSPSADEEAIASATRLARDDIAHTSDLVDSWLRSSADARAGYELTRNNLTRGGFSTRVTLLQSRFSETALVFDVTTTARGEGDNGFGGGHTEKTVRMCVRLTSDTASRPGPVKVANLHCPPGLPDVGADGTIDRTVPWKA